MAHGTFNVPALSAHTFDHGAAALQGEHAKREAELQLQERATWWITRRLAGQEFDSIAALQVAAEAAVVAHYSEPLSEMQATLIRRSVTSIWAGLLDARRYSGRILITRGERVRFLGAA